MSTLDEGARRFRRRLAWAITSVVTVVVVLGIGALVVGYGHGSISTTGLIGQLSLLPPAAAFSIVGTIVALRQPGNACGWLMLAIGAVWSLGVSPPTPSGSTLEWIGGGAWIPPFGLMATHLLLRLPDGRLPSERWRVVSRVATVAIVVTVVGFLFDPEFAANPIANRDLAVLGLVGLVTIGVCGLVSIASLVVRTRRAESVERHQLRWIAAGAVAFLGGWALGIVLMGVFPTGVSNALVGAFVLSCYAAVPVSIGIAILRYRLYDIDVVIRKTLVVAVLAAFFVAVYAAVVGGVGQLVGAGRTSGLSFAAAIVAAVLFQPVLARARRFADRVVYGQRATPYEVLAELGERLGESYDADDVLPRIARVLGEGVGALRARVWLRVGGELRPVAAWPPEADPGLPDDHDVEVRHQGEPLGALSVAMPPNDPMDPGKEKLIADLAGQVGVVLRNVRLTEALRARLDDLKAAQKRLVTAQDQERRRLERNIHDGAQQQLVALNVQLGLLGRVARTDPVKVEEMANALQARATEALEDLRDLARGIYPPLLADKGLAAALEAQARKATLPVQVVADGVDRYPPEVEAAVYFSALEALQNVAKYAEASRATVTLARRDGALTFAVADDGRGFDATTTGYGTGLQGIADRLSALDGSMEVDSRPAAGTVVRGSVPADPVAAEVRV